MSIDDIRSSLDKIRKCSGDSEAAHSMEDELYGAFIAYVATDPNDDDLGEKAKLVLTAEDIEYPRYYS